MVRRRLPRPSCAALAAAAALVLLLDSRCGTAFTGLPGRGARIPLVTAADGAESPPPEEAVPKLLSWLDRLGGFVDERVVSEVGPKGRSLFVKEPVDKNEVLIRLPPDFFLNVAHTPQADLAASVLQPNMEAEIRLALAVIDAMKEGSEWRPYVDAWPDLATLHSSLPVSWTEEQLQAVAGTFPGLYKQVQDRREAIAKVAKLLEMDEAELWTGHDIMCTRAVGSEKGWCVLMPGVDLANHDPKPTCVIDVAGEPGVRDGYATRTEAGNVWEHGSAGLVALRDLAAGEEVCISYGKLPNQRLLLDYGFSMGESNPFGDVEKEPLD